MEDLIKYVDYKFAELFDMLSYQHADRPSLPSVDRTDFTTEEFATMVHRAKWTVCNWCRDGRIDAHKAPSGRGRAQNWRISREELDRYLNEGLLPKR